jgi:hypothetical protein
MTLRWATQHVGLEQGTRANIPPLRNLGSIWSQHHGQEEGGIMGDLFYSIRTFGYRLCIRPILVSIYCYSSGLFSSECRAYL